MNSPALKTTTPSSHSLLTQLQQIGLRALPAEVDDFLARAAKSESDPAHGLIFRAGIDDGFVVDVGLLGPGLAWAAS